MRRRTFISAVVGMSTLGGCFGGGGDDTPTEDRDLADEVTIEISNDSFDPSVVEIKKGGTVTWENTGNSTYRVDWDQFQANSESWEIKAVLDPGETVSHTFNESGRYDFTDLTIGKYNICGRIYVGNVDEGGGLPCSVE